MAHPITAISIKETYSITPGPDGIGQIRIEGIAEDKGMAMLAYRSGDFWLEGHWLSIPAICSFLTKNNATLVVEEPVVVPEKVKVSKADKPDLKAIVSEFLGGVKKASTAEVAKHLGKPTAVANSVLCALERRGMASSKTTEAGIEWKAKATKS